jgi:para-aminobenzoate synthetase component 1
MELIDVLRLSEQVHPFMLCQHDQQHYTAGLGLYAAVSSDAGWPAVDAFIKKHKGQYIFSHICYDVKNDFESLHSNNQPISGFQNAYFWVPAVTIDSADNNYHFAPGHEHFLKNINPFNQHFTNKKLVWDSNQVDYNGCFEKLKQHIQLGDIYEINYCLPFTANGTIDPIKTYQKLYTLTQAPMACFYRFNNQYLLCASPERYLKKTGQTLISQPIKGTAKRATNIEQDASIKKVLQQNEKERSENIMIVDLVRNDLSRIALPGTVKVTELCGAYTFKTVHHLISTIECQIPELPFSRIIEATFPMGSMTGAPKIRAMQLIEQYETAKRGMFSGTVGFIDPEGNFDYNVVIRSIFYDADRSKIAAWAGSAITINAQAANEFEECQLKMAAIKAALSD